MSTRATADSIALLPCPRSGCGTAFSEAGPLAAHLATVHETAPSHAHLEAQTVKQQTANAANAKEATMPCTYCKRVDGTHSERCQTRVRGLGSARCARWSARINARGMAGLDTERARSTFSGHAHATPAPNSPTASARPPARCSASSKRCGRRWMRRSRSCENWPRARDRSRAHARAGQAEGDQHRALSCVRGNGDRRVRPTNRRIGGTRSA